MEPAAQNVYTVSEFLQSVHNDNRKDRAVPWLLLINYNTDLFSLKITDSYNILIYLS